MKTQTKIILTMALALVGFASPLRSQGTAFSYQGQLMDNGQSASGGYDLSFRLYDAPAGGNVVGASMVVTNLAVSNGLFNVELDFGSDVFDGQPLWLQLEVKSPGDTVWERLSPRQPLTPTPYAIHALSVDASGLSGTIPMTNFAPGTVDNSVLADSSVDSLKILNGTILPADVNAASFNGTFWKADGNAGTTPGTHFVGTTDNQPLELHANGTRSLRIEPNSSGAPNMIGGAAVNEVAAGIVGATIGGGGAESGNFYLGPGANHVSAIFGTIGGGRLNTVAADHATIGGGLANTVEPTAYDSFIGGGLQNTARSNALRSVIGGGEGNHTAERYTTIGGGGLNSIGSNSPSGVISGGYNNRIERDAFDATIGGGTRNVVQAGASSATIGGGGGHLVTGLSATIAGGFDNRALAIDATVGGGYTNVASGYRSTISGARSMSLPAGGRRCRAGSRIPSRVTTPPLAEGTKTRFKPTPVTQVLAAGTKTRSSMTPGTPISMAASAT